MITPIILSGGRGTRLWPLSRSLFPKQYWELVGKNTLIQATALRVAAPEQFNPPLVICNEEHRFLVAEQLREINLTPSHIVLETEGRNTAAAIAIACLLSDPNEDLLVLPADHNIKDSEPLITAIQQALPFVQKGKIITFGIQPQHPDVHYGYIKRGSALDDQKHVFSVSHFAEKPNKETAEKFLSEKNYYWNSGMFLFKVKTMLNELKQLQPELLNSCKQVLATAKKDLDFLRLDSTFISKQNALSIDHAVMEKTENACIAPLNIEWSDVGSWNALWSISEKDEDGNAIVGDVTAHNVTNSYIRSHHPLVCVSGLDNILVTATKDAVFIANRDSLDQMHELIATLQQSDRRELDIHTRAYRPWGYYETIDLDKRFQVKRIMVKPGEMTSTQIHYHRSEHWVVVEGIAKVTRGDETFLVHENNSVYLPMGQKHRVENPGKIPLHFIEVQSGSYLGEDDIVRIEDAYGRIKENS